ncbi:hypothetical protein JCM10908_006215 [Rhodotorula pacifica]|uniref:uncharacterized protein n=1 Tax=Rhodotorula pacifica TaxID=1495444 RepID=UPI00318241FF
MSTNTSHPAIPTRFKAAVFPAPGAALELVEVEYRKPGHGKLAIRVEGVVLSNMDAVSELGLLRPYAKFPRTPGTAFCGTIVETGSGAREGGGAGGLAAPISSLMRRISRLGLGRSGGASADDKDKTDGGDVEDYHKWKVGERIIVSATHQGCGEYATAHADSACPIPNDMPLFESVVTATFGAKVLAAQQHHDHHCHHLAEDDARFLPERNEREGFQEAKGAIAVYGQGGFLSLAYHSLRHELKERLLLVSTCELHSHEDYNAPKEDFMHGHLGSGLLDKFRPHGGIKHLICVDLPRREHGFEHLLDCMRHGGQITLLNIERETMLMIPPAHIVARSLTVCGAPDLHSFHMVHALKMCHRFDLHRHVAVKKYAFTEEGVRSAWERVKDPKECWEAHVVYFSEVEKVASVSVA